MADTEKVTVTMNAETRKWLAQTYPEATSRSASVLMAIRDARTHREILDRSRFDAQSDGDD